MDLEKIKQNFRLRSGRTKKLKKTKPGQQATQAPIPNGTVQKPPEPQTTSTTGTAKPKSATTQAPETKVQNEAEHDPVRIHAATSTTPPPEREGPARNQHSEKEESAGQVKPSKEGNMANTGEAISSDSEGGDFDLRPPAPKPRPENLEVVSELLFSPGHLNCLLHDPQSVSKFSSFLHRYKPEYQPLIVKYLETQKAIAAVAYANAVAESATDDPNLKKDGPESHIPGVAATLDKTFEDASKAAFKALVGTALPMYVTYQLVKLVTECLVNEITGKQTPLLRNLVGGLSEVFCLTDPTQDDNPIIYASEEFYRLTGYGTDDVIGRNCRFLQGSKTNRESVRRIKQSTERGEDICESLLNYRRDGRPFINLLMIAPLHDDKGKVKYNIGAQVDVSGLVEGGRGLDDFERYLMTRQWEKKQASGGQHESKRKKKVLDKLRELSQMFDLEESAVVKTHSSRASSVVRDEDTRSVESDGRSKAQRRVFVDAEEDDRSEEEQSKENKEAWNLGQSGPSGMSGRLQGVYDSYMLIRPTSSFRIIFVSPKLRRIGKVVKNPFLSHVAAHSSTLNGLKESFNSGTPVTAKIHFLTEPGKNRYGTPIDSITRQEVESIGKRCWISATPLLGADERVGVWMVVIVEKAKAQKNARLAEVEAKAAQKVKPEKPKQTNLSQKSKQPTQPETKQIPKEEMPIKPKRLDDLLKEEGVDEQKTPEPQDKRQQQLGTPERQDKPEQLETTNSRDQRERQLEDFPTPPKNGSRTNSRREQRNATPDDDHFVQRTPLPAQNGANGRVIIEPDSDDDEAPVELDSDMEHSPDAEHDINQIQRKYTPPPEIPASMTNQTPPPQTPPPPKTPDMGVDDATPTKDSVSADKVDGDENEKAAAHETPSRPSQHPTKSSQILGMDYLTHPGSSRRQTDGVEQAKGSDRWTDVDCMRSPYSVD